MRYHNITKDDMLNGNGLRIVLWVAGCSHGCRECHNPVTWDPDGGLLFDQEAQNELFELLDQDYISGITFSGGDPLHPANSEAITELAGEIRKRFSEKNIWLYTGDVWENIRNFEIMKYIDVLVDGKFDISQKDTGLHWRGSSNQRVIDVRRSREEGKVMLHEEDC